MNFFSSGMKTIMTVKRESEIFPIMAKSGRRIRTKIVTIKKRAESEL